MTSPMGDRVPPLSMTDAQEAELERLQDEALDAINGIHAREVYQSLSLDFLEDLAPGVPFLTPDPGCVDYGGLTRVQRDAWDRLTSALHGVLEIHIDDDALKNQACGGD